MSMRIFTMLLLAILPTGLGCFSQAQRDYVAKINKAKVYEYPVGPVTLTAEEYAAKLCNTSTVQLTQYRIGCIERSDNGFEIVRKDNLINERIEGRGGCITLEITPKDFPFEECTVGKLAVIEVIFADGTSWSLQPSPSR